MRYLLLILFLFPVALTAQEKATGVWYFDGTPYPTPRLPKGVEIGYDLSSERLLAWSRTNNAWEPIVTDVSFDTTGLRNNVYPITMLSDTATITPVEGDFFVKDSTTFGVYGGDMWYILRGGGGTGSGGPVSWNDLINVPTNVVNAIDTVAHDETLVGRGTSQEPLRVDTAVLATRTWAETELDNRIEVEYRLNATGAVASIALPFTPDTRYPIQVFRNAAFQTVSKNTVNGSDWELNGSTLTATYRAVQTGELINIFFTKLQ